MIENIYEVKNNIIVNKYITDINKKRFLRIEAGIMIKTAKNYGYARHSPTDFGYIYSGFYVYEGRGVYIDCKTGTEAVFSKGDFVQRIPGVEHETNCIDENGWREIYILFDGSFFDSLSDCSMMSCEPVLHIGIDDIVKKKMLAAVNRLSLAPDSESPYFLFEMQSLLYEINQINRSNKNIPYVDAACKYIRQHCCHGISMKDVAQAVGVSYNRLRRDFQIITGISMIGYSQIERIKASVYMLTCDKKPIKEVASLTGYANEFIFIKQFTKITGYPPGKYLKLYGGKI